MGHGITGWNQVVTDYIIRFGTQETSLMQALREETAALPESGMQIGPDQGQLLGFLVRLLGVRQALEIGTFTGYSALGRGAGAAIGRQADLRATSAINGPRSAGATGVRPAWQSGSICGSARRSIPWQRLSATARRDGSTSPSSMPTRKIMNSYYEACLRLVRPGGLIAIDNVLWDGAVADPADNKPSTAALKALNGKIRSDDRVDLCLLPIGDGVTLVRPAMNAPSATTLSAPLSESGAGEADTAPSHHHGPWALAAVTALGIVFGDIGTVAALCPQGRPGCDRARDSHRGRTCWASSAWSSGRSASSSP